MKKLLLVGALASALPMFAPAQTNVTMFGVADAGVAFGSRGAGSSNTLRVDSGVLSTSRWGVRGQEDLGGGLSAIFWAEAGWNVDDGTGAAGGGGLNFARRSWVGLQGGFGQIYIGRDYTPGFWGLVGADVFGYGLYGTNLSAFSGQIGANNPILDSRQSNAIFWNSPLYGGLQIKAMYSAGEFDTDPKSRGNAAEIAFLYNAGPVAASFWYHSINSTTNPILKSKRYGVSGGYNFGAVRVVGGYAASDPDGATNTGRLIQVGAGVKLGGGELMGTLYSMKQQVAAGTEPKSTTFGLAYVYPLSKRTDLYASLATVHNNSTGNYVLAWSGGATAPFAPGTNPRSLGVGIRHQF